MRLPRRFILILVAIGVFPWALAPFVSRGPDAAGTGYSWAFDFTQFSLSELVGRLPIMAAFLAAAVLLTYVLGKLRWAEERTRQLDSLFESGDSVVSLQSVGADSYSLIKGTCGKLVQTRGYDAAWIALGNEGEFKVAAEMGHASGMAAITEQMKKGHWPACAQRAMAKDEIVVTRDTVSQCGDCPLRAKRYGQAGLAMRIAVRDRVLGVVCVKAPAAVVTSKEEHMVLTRIARDLGHALHSIEVRGTHKKTADDLEWERCVRSAVAESTDALSARSCTVPEIAQLLLDHAMRLTESREGFVHSIEQRTGVAVPYLSRGAGETDSAIWGSVDAIALTRADDGTYEEPWGRALNTVEPFYSNSPSDLAPDPSDKTSTTSIELAQDEPIAIVNDRMLAVPALAGGRLVGQIVLARPHRNYCDRDLDAVIRLAEIFAVAVERTSNEQDLRIREATVASILDPVLVTDTDGVITHANEAFVRQWHLGNADEAIDRSVGDYFIDAETILGVVERTVADGTFSAELGAEITGGTQLDIKASCKAIADEDGNIIRVTMTLTDLTDEKREAEIKKALWRIAESACTARDLGLLFRKIRQELAKVMSTRNFFVALYDDTTNTISLPLFLDENDQNQFDSLPAGKTLTAYVIRKSSAVRATRAQIDELVQSGSVEVVGTPGRVWLGAPMLAENRVLGVVAVQSYTDENEYDDRDLETLAHAAAEVAPAVARRRAEKALKEEEERFRAVSETVNAALINTDSNGRILTWNRAAESIFGYTADEAVGHPFSLIVPEGFLQAHVDGLMRAVSSDSEGYVRASVEGVGRRKDKSEFPMELSIGAWRTGNETFFTALLTDITTRKQADEELQFLGSIPLQVSDALIVTDLNYRITYVNKAAEFLFGFAGEEMIGRTLDLLSSDSWEEQYRDEIHRTVSAGRIWTGEVRARRQSGSTFPVEFRVSPLRDSSGRLSSYIAICHDLTERFRTEQLLQALNAAALGMERSLTADSILSAVTEEMRKIGSSCAVFTLDDAGATFSIDHMSAGFTASAIANEADDLGHLATGMMVDFIEPLARTVREKKSNFVSCADASSRGPEPSRSENPEAWLAWAISSRPTILAPLIAGEDVMGVLAVQSEDLAASDLIAITAFANQLAAAWRKATLMEELSGSLSELKRTQDILVRAQKMEAVGNLAGGVAHDFNNLLTAITGYAELALAGIDADSPAHSDLTQIRKAAAQAASLTSQLLAFSRQTPLQPKVLSVNEIVSGLDKMMRRLIGEDVALSADLSPDLDLIKADPTQIQQVVMNLIINGRDAMPGGGSLSILTQNVELNEEDCESMSDAAPGSYVLLSVTDTGTGIDPEVVDRIFEPFFTTKELGKGTGLGLSVVYGIVSQHGGWITIKSELGTGTTFLVFLPTTRDRAVELSEDGRPDVEIAGHGERILVVEDEDAVRDFATRALRESGYTVIEASDADEALDLFAEGDERIDLVFSDVVLPSRSGLELAEQIKSSEPDTPILLASGYTDTKAQWEAIRDRGFGFLQKPYGIGELLSTIRETIGSHQ